MTPWHEDMAGKLKQAASWLRNDVKMPGLADACEAGSAAIMGVHERDNEVYAVRQEAETLKAEIEKLRVAAPEAGRRERIATAAMQGILANSKENLTGLDIEWHASEAVRYADALITELDKGDK
jgi:hypothetical protein